MPYPNEHSARITSPGQYDRIRRENDKFGSGIHAIWGVKENKAELQAIRFDKDKFSVAEAKAWLKKHDYKPLSFEPASETKANEFRYFDSLDYIFQELKNGYPVKIQLLKTGKWNHPLYGKFEVTEKDLRMFKESFDNKVRKIDLFIDVEHLPEKGAVAKFEELIIDGGVLYAIVDWTDWGKEILDKRLFNYISPEFNFEWEDPESGEIHDNVLFGAALTNRPFIKGMAPILASERAGIDTNNFPLYKKEGKTREGNDMELKEVLGLFGLKEDAKVEDVKAKIEGLKENTSLKEINKALELKEDTPIADTQKKLKEIIDASKSKDGQITLSEKEAKELKENAEAGKEAMKQLKLNEATAAVEKALQLGKIVPAQKEWAMKQAQADIKTFNEFVTNAPKVITTSENGSEHGEGIKAAEELDKAVKELRAKEKGLKYSDALQRVLSENKDLAKRYEEERKIS